MCAASPPGLVKVMPPTYVFDVETVFLSYELPERWEDVHLLRVAVCDVFDVEKKEHHIFTAAPDENPGMRELFEFFSRLREEGCTLVSFAGEGFDWKVLQGEFAMSGFIPNRSHFDLGKIEMVDLQALLADRLGWRISLENLALCNLAEGKSMKGVDAPKRWRQGRWPEVVEYCKRDVDLTHRLWELGKRQGYLALSTDGTIRVPVKW